jgi:hypothetical protein
MKTTIKEITPQWAAKILETRNPKNRPFNHSTVTSYAADIRAGHWVLSHQGIAFDENGDLMDGQHRLMAVVAAKTAIQSLVTTGIPAIVENNGIPLSTMDVVDRHRVRGIGQQLTLSHGWQNGNRVAATVRGIALFYAIGDSRSKMRITTPQTVSILGLCGESVRAVIKLSHTAKDRANGKVLAACAIYHSRHPQKALAFLESYLTTIGWQNGCPQKALERWRTHNPTEMSSGRHTAVEAAAAALFYHHRQEPVHILRVQQPASSWLINLNPELRDAVRKQIS